MDKKTVKVIEKYSMPFVQLVLEKGEEDRIFQRLFVKLRYFLVRKKQLLSSKIQCHLYCKTLSRFLSTITEQIFFMIFL